MSRRKHPLSPKKRRRVLRLVGEYCMFRTVAGRPVRVPEDFTRRHLKDPDASGCPAEHLADEVIAAWLGFGPQPGAVRILLHGGARVVRFYQATPDGALRWEEAANAAELEPLAAVEALRWVLPNVPMFPCPAALAARAVWSEEGGAQ